MRLRCLLAAAFALPWLGCGGSSDTPTPNNQRPATNVGDGGTIFSSGFAADRMVADLTEQEFAQVCGASYSYQLERFSGGGVHAFCKLVGYLSSDAMSPTTDGQLVLACQDFYNFCIGSPPSPDILKSIQMCPHRSTQCTATVGELERCYTDLELASEASWEMLPDCHALTLKDLPLQFPFPDIVPSCDAYFAKCPDT